MKSFFNVLFNMCFFVIDITLVIGCLSLIIILYNRLKDSSNIIGMIFAIIMVVIGFRLVAMDILNIVKRK